MSAPDFPPLITGAAVDGDPFAHALAAARQEADPGRLWWRGTPHRLDAALELAPQMPLEDAIGAVLAAGLGLADAVGVVAPPEMGLFFRWPAIVRVNGADCGHLAAAASRAAPQEEPDWLVVGASIALASSPSHEPGAEPGRTSLSEEGCAVTATALVDAFARHTLSWLYTFEHEGLRPLHDAFLPKLEGVGEPVMSPRAGTFVGLDERGGMILREGAATTILPLTILLEEEWRSSHE